MERVFRYGQKKKVRSLLLLFLVLILVGCPSCSSFHYAVKLNHRKTERFFHLLFERNENAFYVDAAWCNGSVVWSYQENQIEIYKLRNGRIIKKQLFDNEGIHKLSESQFKSLDEEMAEKCPPVLDGDGCGFIIDSDSIVIQADYSIEVDEMKRQSFESVFLTKVVDDMNTYMIWNWSNAAIKE